MKILLTVLIQKMKLGVVADCKYLYRRRSAGEASLIQSVKKKYGWYFDYFTYLIDWAVEFYREHLGYVPACVQYELLCDLQWRFREMYDMSEVLTEEEIGRYKGRLFASLRYFDDKYILEQKMVWAEHKCYMLSKKYNHAPALTERYSDVLVHFGNTNLPSFADQYSMIEFISIADGTVTVEGFTKVFGVDMSEPLEVYLKCGGQLIACEIIPRESINEYRFGELIFRGIKFRGKIPLTPEQEDYYIQLVLKYRNTEVVKRNLRFGQFAPVGIKYANSHYYKDGYMLTATRNSLYVRRCGRKGRVTRELKFLKELWFSKDKGSRKAVFARLAYHGCTLFCKKPIWIFRDRAEKAGDNAEAMFRFVQGLPDHSAQCVFSLNRSSLDYAKLKKCGTVIEPLSWKEKFMFLRADFIISSHFDYPIIRPFQQFSEPYRDISQEQKFVFLQHGVTKDDLSKWLNRYERNVAIFVTAANPEYRSILNGNYGYTDRQVKLTGFPRFDLLENHTKKFITIMPTWRAYLVGGMDPHTGKRQEKPNFKNSLYYSMYCKLLSAPKLFDAAEKLGYTIRFLNHPNMTETSAFKGSDLRLQYLDANSSYQSIFSESAMIITDYSSVAFDFAYLRKPVMYFQLDNQEFFSGAHTYEKGTSTTSAMALARWSTTSILR